MSKRYTIEDVKKMFSDRGYTLLSVEYVSSKHKLDYICPKGHKGSISFSSFRRGRGCSTCGRASAANKNRLSFEEVRGLFANNGYTLVSTSYVNNSDKLDYICPKGHRGSISYSNFSEGKRCPICSNSEAASKRRTKFIDVVTLFNNNGYTVLSSKDEFKNNKSYIRFICPNGHKGSIRYSNFKSGHRCSECSGITKWDIDKVRRVFSDRGYTLVSDKYINVKSNLEYICPKGHRGSIRFSSFLRGAGCKICGYKKVADQNRLSFDEVSDFLSSFGYTVISTEYIDSHSPIRYVCPKGHDGTMTFTNFRQGKRCPRCANSQSRAELELRDYVAKIVGKGKIIANSRNIIPPYELDIYIPSKKVAIEYCGLYWHSEVSGGKPRKYHRAKMDMCTNLDIRLLTIFEDEYLNKPEVVRSRITNALGLINRRVFARKCSVSEIDVHTASSFLEKYHLQGSSPSSYRLGLFYEGELLQVLTVGSITRAHAVKVNGKRTRMLELKRFASVPGVLVIGGASKLFKRVMVFARAKRVEYIKSYSDNRYAVIENSVYSSLGFELISETKYTPHYVLGGIRVRNQNLRKTPEERSSGKSEWELRRKQGYDRIWDCGHKTYLLKIMY